jgi:hypothetical protein
MTAPTVTDPARLTHALADVDRLLRNETNRARHMLLTGIRADITAVLDMARPGSDSGASQSAA